MTQQEILNKAPLLFNQLSTTVEKIDTITFFEKPDEKWSIAENIQHLIISTKATTLAYRLPLFLVKWIGGISNRPSVSFEALSAQYYKKLEDGAKASGRFIPKPITIKSGKEKLLYNWKKATENFLVALKKNRTESELDHYVVKHPLLGLITLRELCYFTLFHTSHHLTGIEDKIKTRK